MPPHNGFCLGGSQSLGLLWPTKHFSSHPGEPVPGAPAPSLPPFSDDHFILVANAAVTGLPQAHPEWLCWTVAGPPVAADVERAGSSPTQ